MNGVDLVVFDCDGVLVDSELLSLAVAREALAREGLALDAAMVRETYLGRSAAFLAADAGRRLGRALAADFLDRLADDTFAAFRSGLNPIPHVRAAIEALSLPRCVASSSTHARIALSLRLAGLADLFEGRAFSAADVARGKPAPDLYLFAAERCGVDPARCLVVEDSVAGVAAARAAGMAALGFLGGSHVDPARDGPALREAGAAALFDDMRALDEAIARLSLRQ